MLIVRAPLPENPGALGKKFVSTKTIWCEVRLLNLIVILRQILRRRPSQVKLKKLWLDKITYEDKEITNLRLSSRACLHFSWSQFENPSGSNNFAILWASFCNSDYIHGLFSVERHEIILTHVVLRPSSPPLSGYRNISTLDIDGWYAEYRTCIHA